MAPRRVPVFLYHYTSLKAVLEIIRSRSMWATSVEQLQDQAEICYGADIVREEVRRQRGLAQFSQQVLSAIPEQVMSRRALTFVTCFRPKLDENERAPYCLMFNTLADRDGCPEWRLIVVSSAMAAVYVASS